MVRLATISIIRTVSRLFHYWEPEELCIGNIKLTFDQRVSDVLLMDIDATVVISLHLQKNYIAKLEWWFQYI